MEKLVFVLLLNGSDMSSQIVQKYEMESQFHCISQTNYLINDKDNPVVYEDELGPVFKWAGYCLTKKESEILLIRK